MPDPNPSNASDDLPRDAVDDRTAAAAVDQSMPNGEPGMSGIGGEASAAAAVSMALAGGPMPSVPGAPGFLGMTDALAASEAAEEASVPDRATDRSTSG